MMNLDTLRDMLRRHEGLRLKPYPCSKGKMTIGYGWNLSNPLPKSISAYLNVKGQITEEIAERLLAISIDAVVRQCWAIWPNFGAFTERRQLALADFVYNVGAGTALKFKQALSAIYDGDWNKAADEFQDSKWFKQTGSRSAEICAMVREG